MNKTKSLDALGPLQRTVLETVWECEEASAHQVKISEEERKSTVALGVEASRSQGTLLNESTSTFEDGDIDSVLLTLTFSWPMVNKTLDAGYSKALYKRRIAEEKKKQVAEETLSGQNTLKTKIHY